MPKAIESCLPLPWAAVRHVHLGPYLFLSLQAQGTHIRHEWQHLSGIGSPGSEGLAFIFNFQASDEVCVVYAICTVEWVETERA